MLAKKEKELFDATNEVHANSETLKQAKATAYDSHQAYLAAQEDDVQHGLKHHIAPVESDRTKSLLSVHEAHKTAVEAAQEAKRSAEAKEAFVTESHTKLSEQVEALIAVDFLIQAKRILKATSSDLALSKIKELMGAK